MTEDKSEKTKTETIFISYLDDNNDKISTYVTLIEETDNRITFRTHQNIITLPISRVLKIKKNLGGIYGRQD
jgi:hypothetical protein